MYICIAERKYLVVYPFGYLFLERKYFFITLLLMVFFKSFHLEVKCSRRVIHLWYRVNQRHSRKPLLYYLVCRYKQLHCKNYFYCIIINEKGNGHVMNPFNGFLIVPFFRLFFWMTFHSIPIFNAIIILVIVYDITCVHSLTCVINLNPCFLSNLFSTT